MFTHYSIIALRNLLKNKANSLMLIMGLAIGMAASVAILIINYSEMTWDKAWSDAEHIYEIEQIFTGRDQPLKANMISSAERLQLQEQIAEIEYAGRMTPSEAIITRIPTTIKNEISSKEVISNIDVNIIKIFGLNATQGNLTDFETHKQAVVISDAMAKKYFGNENPVGQIIQIEKQEPPMPPSAENVKKEKPNTNYKIVAVINNIERRSSLKGKMDFLIAHNEQLSDASSRWFSPGGTFVKLKPGVNLNTVKQSLIIFSEKYMSMPGYPPEKSRDLFHLSPINIQDVHLHSFGAEQAILRINFLYALAGIILLLACINYINLAIASYIHRQKEIALRKTLGSYRWQIVVQFLVESLTSATIALLLTFIIIEPLMPWLGTMLGMNIELNYFSDVKLLGFIVSIGLVVGIASGIYPGLYLSQIKPGVILKANQSHETAGSIKLRSWLVLTQFFIASILLSSMGIVSAQLHNLLNYNPGYATQNIVFLSEDSLMFNPVKADRFKQAIAKIPGVLAVAKTTGDIPGLTNDIFKAFSSSQKPEDAMPIPIQFMFDEDELQLFDIPLIAGERFPSPNVDGNQPKIIINQQALHAFGFSSATDAVGKNLQIQMWENLSATIIGVTPNLHMGDQNKPAGPVVFMRLPKGLFMDWGTLGVRFANHLDRKELTSQLRTIFTSESGKAPQEFFIEDLTQKQYSNQILISKFIYIFTALAIFISCMGLYGLVAFAAKKRTKEIGLRKVHGAAITDIIRLLLWQFTKPIIYANLVAWPLALYLINRWLENFNQRIDLWVWGPMYCLAAGALAIFIALLTVGGQAYAVARAKPADALREE